MILFTVLSRVKEASDRFDFAEAFRLLEVQIATNPDSIDFIRLIEPLRRGRYRANERQFSLAAITEFRSALERALEKYSEAPEPPQSFPRITLVTPVFNQKALLRACMHSVLSQKYPRLEYIVMDGGSTDGSVDVIRQYEDELTFWQSEKDGGPYAAVQEGFARSTGEIMGWLNADDLLHPGGLFNIARTFVENPEVRWATGKRVQFDARGLSRQSDFVHARFCRESLLQPDNLSWPFMFVMQEATYWRRSLWEEAGGCLDPDLTLAADFELWARFSRFSPLQQTDTLFGGFRDHSFDQRSRKFWDQYVQEVESVLEREKDIPLEKKAFHSNPPAVLFAKKEVPRMEVLPYEAPVIAESAPDNSPSMLFVTIAGEDKRYLAHCVETVFRQVYSRLKHVVIDVEPTAASTAYLQSRTNTLQHISVSRNELPFLLDQVLREGDEDVMHIGTASVRYDLYCCLAVAALFAQNPQVNWLHGRFCAFDDQGEDFWQAFTRVFCRRYFLNFNFYDPVLQLESVFWKRTLWIQAGEKIDTSLQHAFDGELWLRFFRHTPLYTTLHCLAAFHWPHAGFWSRDAVPYVLEMRRAINAERADAPVTRFDQVEPPPPLSIQARP